MFHSLQLEVMDRFTTVERYFRVSLPKDARFKGELSQTSKGLVFVQIYAIHEHTVLKVVQHAVDAIAAHSHSYSDLRPSLLSLFLDPQLTALRECGQKSLWDRRLDLLDLAVSNKTASLSQAPLPADGSHFRHGHVNLILRVFGITRKLTLRRRHLFFIDQVVNNRNAISHGEETAAEVGRRYSRSDIYRSIRIMQSLCLRLILIFSEYCNEPTKHCR
jgi:hypothetical protein